MVEQPGDGMQADQPVAGFGQAHVPVLQLLAEVMVRGDQCRQLQAEEGNGFAKGAEDQPAEQRGADHQGVQRQVHELGGDGLPGGNGRHDFRGGCDQARDQAHPDQSEDAQAQHEVGLLHQFAPVGTLREQAAKLHGEVDHGNQYQHQPVQPDGQAAIAVFGVFPAHHASSRSASSGGLECSLVGLA